MSAAMFATKNDSHIGPDYSRIPISTSPLPLRRSNSLRLKGEKLNQYNTRLSSKFPAKQHERDRSRDSNLGCTTPVNVTAHPRLEGDVNDLRSRRNSQPPTRIGVNGCNHLKTDIRPSNTPKGGVNPHSPRTKTLSLSLSTTKLHNQKSPTISLPSTTPPTSPYGTNQSNPHNDWDLESLASTTSNLSLSSCDHAAIARNGTTFSGRSMRYIFHCNQNAAISGDEYLTPTQRAHRQIKKLKGLLHQARLELEQKDSDILKLTKEVVELRLYKAAICSPEDRSNSSDAVTVRENNSDDQITPESVNGVEHIISNCADSGGAYIDSGHFEDLDQHEFSKNDSLDQTDSLESPQKYDKSVETCEFEISSNSEQKLILEYEKRIQELIKIHEDENYQMKQKHNDKIEELLARIGDINQRYWQMVPELEAAKDRIKDLEKELEDSCAKLEDLEKKKKEKNLQLSGGSQTLKLELDNQITDIARRSPSRLSVPELLEELQITKNELENLKAMYRQLMEAKSKNKIDPEVTLQFLKSAIYYFLTDKENTGGHLRAIQSILGFSQNEISNIDKAQFQ